MPKLPSVTYTPELIESMRGWVADCVWGDLTEDDIKGLSATVIARGVERHYEGGIVQFIEDGA